MLESIIITIMGGLIGGFVSLRLYKKSETKEKEDKRLNELHSLIQLTKSLVFIATDTGRVMGESKKDSINQDIIKDSQLFFNDKIFDYILASPFHAIHIDEKTYNKTLDFIECIHDQTQILGQPMSDSDKFYSRTVDSLDEISKKGFELLNFIKRNNLII